MNLSGRRLVGAQRLMQLVVSAPDPEIWLGSAATERLQQLGLSERDAQALAASDPRRLLIYRKLVRGTLRDTFSAELPRTAARLGPERLTALVAAFCEQRLPVSQVLRDVPFEICAWALPGQTQDLPPFMADLARFELFEFDVYAAERQPRDWPEATADELSAELAVAFDGSMRLTQLGWRTDALPDDPEDRTTPQQQQQALLAYRDDDGAYRQLELTPLASAILQRLWRGEQLGAAIRAACAASGDAIDQSLIDGVSVVLSDLADRKVLLGACASGLRQPPSPWAGWLCGLGGDDDLAWNWTIRRPGGITASEGMNGHG